MMNSQKKVFPVLIHDHRFVMPASARAILIQENAGGGLSYKAKSPLTNRVKFTQCVSGYKISPSRIFQLYIDVL